MRRKKREMKRKKRQSNKKVDCHEEEWNRYHEKVTHVEKRRSKKKKK